MKRTGLPFGVAAILAGCTGPLERTPLPEQASSPESESCAARLAGASSEVSLSVTEGSERQIPVTLFLPEQPGEYPLLGFSHGAFASPTRYRAMLAPLASAGYIVIAPMHVDSEEFGSDERPDRDTTWRTRNEDMALALNPNQELLDLLEAREYTLSKGKVASVGHSYGAIMAQLPGGALAYESDGSQVDRADPDVDVVVGWSPPGSIPTMIDAEGWNTLAVPSLTITGTTDVLPGFIDDWRAHLASYENAPIGKRASWVGEGIDHYFGGMFGREKPADANSQRLFHRAMEISLNFMDRHIGSEQVCTLGPPVSGEAYQEDGA
ncbi:alpha/beta fold hydrolase [Altererythrobacter sp. JGD-16]|uniref:Alpha/beta fold hydrolase n=1 Tax=Altererythrobacter lutimaris TaxID=2743979 RepID=A0A850H966_9SPHN|nr:alpha/beta fold hydrolase [Altererythrobacter lutimaris]